MESFSYLDLSPQQLEIYLILKDRYPSEVHISEITNDRHLGGLGIKGYSERITELRKHGFKITNTRKSNYVISSDPKPSITDLRFLWREAKKRGYKNLMQRCEQKGQSIKFASTVKESLI